jgi:hypothetical protein
MRIPPSCKLSTQREVNPAPQESRAALVDHWRSRRGKKRNGSRQTLLGEIRERKRRALTGEPAGTGEVAPATESRSQERNPWDRELASRW